MVKGEERRRRKIKTYTMFSTPKWDIDDVSANMNLFENSYLHKNTKRKKKSKRLKEIDESTTENKNKLSPKIKHHSKAIGEASARKINFNFPVKDMGTITSSKRSENKNASLYSTNKKQLKTSPNKITVMSAQNAEHRNTKKKKKSRKLKEMDENTRENKNRLSPKLKHHSKAIAATNAQTINFPVGDMGTVTSVRPENKIASLYSTNKKQFKTIPNNIAVMSVQNAEPVSVSKRKRKRKHSFSVNTSSLQQKIKKQKLNESDENDQLLSQSGAGGKSDENIIKKLSKQEKKKVKRLKKKILEQHNDMQKDNGVDLHVHHQVSKTRKFPFSINKLRNIITTSRNANQSERENIVSKKQDKKQLSLREKMMRRLKASRFRYINEQLYTSDGKDAKTYFQSDPDAFIAYHEGYKQQIKQWPINPLDVIIKSLKKKSSELVVADFGCGDARLAHSIKNKVHSFDLVATSEEVTACNMAHTPLSSASVDIVVFCLSLMGNNLTGYISEANRVLKEGGLLTIAEVESRFESVDIFIQSLQKFGFVNTWKDLSHNLFYFMDFKKEKCISKKMKSKLPELSLKPCLYKKR